MGKYRNDICEQQLYVRGDVNVTYNDYRNSCNHIDLIELNIDEINIGDINISINGSLPLGNQGYREPELVGSSGFTEKEIESRMKFFKANSP